MNVYKIDELAFEPFVIMTDHHERAISKFHWALAGGFGFLPAVNFAVSWIDPATLPEPDAMRCLMRNDLEGFAHHSMGRWERVDFR